MVLPLLLGGFFAFLHLDARVFFENHNETGNKYSGDALTHLTGLNYFVQDEWRFPLLDIPDLAFAEGGGNIIYTDSLPLLALPAKIWYQIHPVLPDYFGFWLLVCLTLQPVAFCWCLRQTGALSGGTAIFGSIFALAVPAFLARSVHITLCSHFLILFAIGAYFVGRRDTRRGTFMLGLLTIISMLVTAYLFAMVFGVFAVHLVQSWRDGKRSLFRAMGEGSALCIIIAAFAWILGYWAFDRYGPPPSGFGYFSMNLVSPFWPQNSGVFPNLAPSPDATGGQFEGMNYLGLGTLLSLLLIIVRRYRAVTEACARHPWLAMYMVFLVLYSVSHVAYFGSKNLFHLPLSDSAVRFLSQFRGSGRMFWPVAYILMLFLVTQLSRWRGVWRLALPLVVTLQAIDVWPFVGAPVFRGLPLSKENAERWQELIGMHERVYAFPSFARLPLNLRAPHQKIQYIASKLFVPISSGYMSRWLAKESPLQIDYRMLRQPFDEEALYVFIPPAMTSSAAIGSFGNAAELRKFDGVLIASKQIELLKGLAAASAPDIALGMAQRLKAGEEGLKYLYGDLEVGADFVWTDARKAGVVLRSPDSATDDLVFRFSGITFLPLGLSERIVSFTANGHPLGEISIDANGAGMRQRALRIPRRLIGEGGLLKIEWMFDTAPSPKESGTSGDPRRLGFGLSQFSLGPMNAELHTFQARDFLFSEPILPEFIMSLNGIAGVEEWGRWTVGATAEIEIQLGPAVSGATIGLRCFALLPYSRPHQRVTVFVNGEEKSRWMFDVGRNEALHTISLDAPEIPTSGVLKLRLEIEDPRAPADFGESQDRRQLGLALLSLRLETVGGPEQ